MTPSIVLSVVELARLSTVSSAPAVVGSVLPGVTLGPALDLGKARQGFVVVALDAAPSPSPSWSPAWSVVVRSRREIGEGWREAVTLTLTGEGRRTALEVGHLDRFCQIAIRAARCGADASNFTARLEHA